MNNLKTQREKPQEQIPVLVERLGKIKSNMSDIFQLTDSIKSKIAMLDGGGRHLDINPVAEPSSFCDEMYNFNEALINISKELQDLNGRLSSIIS